ncbi:MAG: hypothetical protein Q9167_005762 [Letrouitia subvulpina]
MSLSVHDSRSRGKSPSRSREHDRAPSPYRPSKDASRKSKKYYDDDSESDSKHKKHSSSRKYRDGSDSDNNHRTHHKKYRDESGSDDKRKKHSKKRYSDDDSDRVKKSSKKYYDRDSGGSDSSSSSSSESDHHTSKHKKSKPKHGVAESQHRRELSPDSHTRTHKGEYQQSSKPQFERERNQMKTTSFAEHGHHEYSRPTEYTRHLSNSSIEGSGQGPPMYNLPGQFKPEYEYSQDQARHLSMVGGQPQQPQYLQNHQVPQYGHAQSQQSRPEAHRIHSGSSAGSAQYHYADPSQNITYMSKADQRRPSYTQSAHPQFVEAKPHSSVMHAPPSPGLGPKMHRLSVSGGHSGALALTAPGQNHGHSQSGLPPGSPLLEAYHGTYQSISPMPSPLMLPSTMDDGIDDLEPLSPGYSSGDSRNYAEIRPRKVSNAKRVSFYDPEPDALALAAALKHTTPDSGPVVKILPHLSDDHILQLRTEYKKHIKVSGKGINIAKHIKLKVPGNLGKAAYAVALGRWESEAHWANFWYQSNSSRRELLIESLMGRTNSDIVKIKDAFSDKRYNDSLEKCMQTELKKDKFRNAVLLALEERRMSESEKLNVQLIRRDVQDLYAALTSKEGGETAMIDIIVVRSDNHLREVLRTFEASYRKNFAREMIAKSRNLVGETLAHILNGVLNRPVRDALLLHQAINETSKDRTDLLVSRLVRFHWEPKHLEKIKAEYQRKYRNRLEADIDEGTKGDFGAFCLALCGGGVR